ncbi:CpaF family protein, partial [Cribrihabitans sp. XS_ASV171]
MFSRYKKQGKAEPVQPAKSAQASAGETPAPQPTVIRKPSPKRAAEAAPMDRDRKRKERLGEIKIELHRELLDNLNLAALEHAEEKELRAEISAIASEILEQKGVVLN